MKDTILASLFIIAGLCVGGVFGWVTHDTTIPSIPTKEYPVRVYLYGEWNNYFDCDSANLNYAWKDGTKIELKNVYQIKFN